MFGYVTINKPELKIREFEEYQAWYCGLCQALKERYGKLGQATLTYDMTFLSMVLSGVYEPSIREEKKRCITHPGKKHPMKITKYTEYAADMNILLAYHNLMDDWKDDTNVASLAFAKSLERAAKKVAKAYPKQNRAILQGIRTLTACERTGEKNIDRAAGCMGELLGELFAYEQDIFTDSLYKCGFFLGKFIYLMDAYEDIEKDKAAGLYNPFGDMFADEHFEEEALAILNMMMAESAAAFEKLPILQNVEILRNILYSGVWVKHSIIYAGRKKRTGQ